MQQIPVFILCFVLKMGSEIPGHNICNRIFQNIGDLSKCNHRYLIFVIVYFKISSRSTLTPYGTHRNNTERGSMNPPLVKLRY